MGFKILHLIDDQMIMMMQEQASNKLMDNMFCIITDKIPNSPQLIRTSSHVQLLHTDISREKTNVSLSSFRERNKQAPIVLNLIIHYLTVSLDSLFILTFFDIFILLVMSFLHSRVGFTCQIGSHLHVYGL